jgi:methylmalonyl-CoA mutase
LPSRSKRCVPRRADDVAHRRTALTGVNEYPNLAEPPLPHGDSTFTLERYAAGFEKLRDRSDAYLEKSGARPPVLLLPLGPLAEHNIRATFAANLLASGRGGQPGNRHSRRCRGGGFGRRFPTVAVVCGTDARCGTDASGVVESARGAGLSQIYRAGPQKAVADVDEDGRPDDYLTAKIDAVEALLTRLGA